jgi:hypothetical protein
LGWRAALVVWGLAIIARRYRDRFTLFRRVVASNDFALAGHGHAAFARMSPSGGDGEIARFVERAFFGQRECANLL